MDVPCESPGPAPAARIVRVAPVLPKKLAKLTSARDAELKTVTTSVLPGRVDTLAADCVLHGVGGAVKAALQHEEERSGYFQTELQSMMNVHETNPNVPIDSPDHVISTILAQSQLARDLSAAYTDLAETGTVQMLIGGWVTVSYRVCAAEHPKYRTAALMRWTGPIAVRQV